MSPSVSLGVSDIMTAPGWVVNLDKHCVWVPWLYGNRKSGPNFTCSFLKLTLVAQEFNTKISKDLKN